MTYNPGCYNPGYNPVVTTKHLGSRVLQQQGQLSHHNSPDTIAEKKANGFKKNQNKQS